jgi:hypothetical protein
MRAFLATISCVLLFLCFFNSPVYADLSFSKSVIDSRLSGAYTVMSVDLDRDGKNDILAAGGNNVVWYKNSGTGSFSKRTIGNLSGTWWVYAADVDRDGDIDVLAASPKLNQVQFYQNKGGESFNSYVVGTGVNAECVYAADLDGDKDLDIVASDWENNRVVRWRYDGGQRFTMFVVDANLGGAHSVTAADFDRDGKIDIAASGSGKINWYKNNDGSFSGAKSIASGGSLCIHSIDFNRDGKQDLLATGRQSGEVAWYQGSGGGSFSKRVIASSFGDSWSVHAADMDKDGDLDVTAGSIDRNYVKAWINDGSNSKFKEYLVDGNINNARAVWVADFDGDGDADITSAARKSNQIAWYKVSGSSTIASREANDADGNEIAASGSSLPVAYTLEQNFPNPFNPETRIAYELPQSGYVRLVVYDVLGREVIALISGERPAGRHSVTWNGIDAQGQRASSGVYFYRLHAGGFTASKRMMLVQ